MTTFTWATPGTLTSALTTELNSLANAAFSSASSAIDNETGKHPYMGLELVLASLTPTGSPVCYVYLLAAVDGTPTFEDGPNTASIPIAVFPFTTAVAAKRQAKANILIPPFQFKLALQNNMGPALAASGNTLKYRLYDELGT